MVGASGFEPPTPCTPCRCATGLRHAPTFRSTPLPEVGSAPTGDQDSTRTIGQQRDPRFLRFTSRWHQPRIGSLCQTIRELGRRPWTSASASTFTSTACDLTSTKQQFGCERSRSGRATSFRSTGARSPSNSRTAKRGPSGGCGTTPTITQAEAYPRSERSRRRAVRATRPSRTFISRSLRSATRHASTSESRKKWKP